LGKAYTYLREGDEVPLVLFGRRQCPDLG